MPIYHGTWSGYTRGCRCQKCRAQGAARRRGRLPQLREYLADNRERLAQQQSISKEAAVRNGRPWEPWEDEIAGDYSRTVPDIAAQLQRSTSAVRNRRRIAKLRERWYANHILDLPEAEVGEK